MIVMEPIPEKKIVEIDRVAGQYRVMDYAGKRFEFRATKQGAKELKRKWDGDYKQADAGEAEDLGELSKSDIIRQKALMGWPVKQIQEHLMSLGHPTRYQMVYNVMEKMIKAGTLSRDRHTAKERGWGEPDAGTEPMEEAS